MALLKTCLVIFVVAVAHSWQEPEVWAGSLDSQIGFGLQDLVRYFGIGGKDDDCKDCISKDQQGLLEIIKNSKRPKEKYVIPASKALIKKLLYKLLTKRPRKSISLEKIKSKIKKCNKPLSLQFLQQIIRDCVKDVVRAVNSNSSLVPVDNQVTERSREKVQDLYNKFVPMLEQEFEDVNEALKKVNVPQIVKEAKERIRDIVEDSKIKIESLIQFFNGTSGKYDDKLKNVREIIKDNTKKFTERILSSKCISLRKSKAAFCKCLEPIYIRFTCNLTKQIEKVDNISKTIQIIGREAIKYVEKNIEKVLNEAEEKAKEELNKLAEFIKQDSIDKEEFLKNKSEEASILIETVTDWQIVNSQNNIYSQKENIQNLLDRALEYLKKSQEPLINAINIFLQLSCPSPLSADPSTDIKKVEKYIEEKSKEIKILYLQILAKINNAGKVLVVLENGVKTLQEEFSASNVSEKCRKLKPNVFIICVNSTYKKLKLKLNPLINNLQNVYSVEILKKDFTNLKEGANNILKKAARKARKAARKAKRAAKILTTNDDFLNATIKKYEEIINTELSPLNCKADDLTKGAISELDQTLSDFIANITNTIESFLGPNLTLTEKDTKFIQENIDTINNKVNEYKRDVNAYQNYLNIVGNDFRQVAFNFNKPNLKKKCQNAFCSSQTALADCVNEETSKLKDGLAILIEKSNEILNKIGTLNIKAGGDLNNEIQNILLKVNETYNGSVKCFKSVINDVNNLILDKIDKLNTLTASIRNSIKTVTDKTFVIVKENVSEVTAVLNKVLSVNREKYELVQKEFFTVLQVSENKINNNINVNTGRVNSLEIRVNEIQEILKSILADFEVKAIKTCNREKECIEKECKNINGSLSEIEQRVKTLEERVKLTFENIRLDVNKTVLEEVSKIILAANKARIDAEDVIKREEFKKANDDYVNRVLNASNIKINSEVNPTFDNAGKVLNNLITDYDKVPSDLDNKLTSIVLISYQPGEELEEDDKNIIKGYVDNIKQIINEYKNKVNGIKDEVNNLETNFNKTKTVYVIAYFDKQCEENYTNFDAFKVCVDSNIAVLNNASDKVVNDVNELLRNAAGVKEKIDIPLKQDIALFVQTVTEVYTMNRNGQDQNNATTSAGLMAECVNSVNKRLNDTLGPIIVDILKIEEDLVSEVKKQADTVSSVIKSVYRTEIETLDFVIFLNPKETAKYNKQIADVNASLDETIKRINNIVNENLNQFSEIREKVLEIRAEVETKQVAFAQNLNKSCADVYSSKTNYSKCIDAQCTKFNDYLTEKETALNDLLSDATILSFDILFKVPSALETENTTAAEKSMNEIDALFKENNVNQETVLNVALRDLATFNTTRYLNNVNLINQRAIELRNRQNNVNNSANNLFSKIAFTFPLHEYAASHVCPKVSIKNEIDLSNNLLQNSKNKVLPYMPNFNGFVSDELSLAAYYDKLLKDQISSLQPDSIKVACAPVLNDFLKLFQCLKSSVSKFSDVFTRASDEVKLEAQDALYELYNRTVVLNQWRHVNVAKEISALSSELESIQENFYKGPCKVTKNKLLDFATLQVDNRYNSFKQVLSNLESNVSDAADVAATRDYKNFEYIKDKLNVTQDLLKAAIAAAQVKNASYVTPQLLQKPQNYIGLGIRNFQKFLEEIPLNASTAKAEAKQLIVQSQNLYENRSASSGTCYSEKDLRPLSSFIVCNNQSANDFEAVLTAIQAKLEDIAKQFVAINSAYGVDYVKDYANRLAVELKTAAALSAVKIHVDNKIDIPENLKPFVKSNCLVATGNNCIVTV